MFFLSFLFYALSAVPQVAWLIFIFAVPLLIGCQNLKRPSQIFLAGWGYGSLILGIGLFWITNTSWWLFGLATISHGWLIGVWLLAAHRLLTTKNPGWLVVILLSCLWINIEWLRSLGFLAMPTGWVGYQLAPYLPLLQIAEITGVYGLSGLILFTNIALFLSLSPKAPLIHRILIPTGLITLWTGIGFWGQQKLSTATPEGQIRVALIQGHINDDAKWDLNELGANIAIHETITRTTLPDQPQLIIWPETTVPCFLLHPQRHDVLKRISQFAKDIQTPILLGTQHLILSEHDKSAFNAAVLLNSDGKPQGLYAKMKLVPFIEHAPLKALIPLISSWGLPAIYSPGQTATILKTAGLRFAAVICFETLFPQTIRRFVINRAAFLVNITNDAVALGEMPFFYRVNADMVRMRAIENRRSFARAANNGISLLIDPWGRVLQSTEINIQGSLTGTIPLMNKITFYTRFGDWVVGAGWLVLSAGWLFRRRTNKSPE